MATRKKTTPSTVTEQKENKNTQSGASSAPRASTPARSRTARPADTSAQASATAAQPTRSRTARGKAPASEAAVAAPRTDDVLRTVVAGQVTDSVPPEVRHLMISEAAYFIAEHRGFSGGDPVADWLSAEQEIDASVSARAH